MITQKFNDKTGILESKFEGEITILEIVKYINSLSNNDLLPKTLKIFTDASQGRFTEDAIPADLEKLVEANIISLSKREAIFDAFVISSSLETAFGMLYQEFSKADNYFFGVFSEKKSAIDWLQESKF